VNLTAFLGVQSLGLDHLFKSGSDIGSIGPAISLPIFNGGRLKAQYKARRADYDEAVASYNDAVARALREVADNAVSQKALGQQLLKVDEAVAAAAEAHRIASNRYEGGLSNYLEVLLAEDNLLNSMNAQTNLRSRSFTLDISLQCALGGGYQVAQR
jgi:outer membrane protein TolC